MFMTVLKAAFCGAISVLAIATVSAQQAGVAPVSVARGTMAPIPDLVVDPVSVAKGDAVDAGARRHGETHCLATAIYFEARGESMKGQKAVAEVILARARTRGRPKTICGVVYEGAARATGCQFSFTCDGIADVVRDRRAWKRAQRAAAAAMRMRGKAKLARGATFYHANYVTPYWAASMVKVAQIGSHIFYRP